MQISTTHHPPDHLAGWLYCQDSLTRRLGNQSDTVCLLQQYKTLRLTNGVFNRKVALIYQGTPVIYAHTFMPLYAIKGQASRIRFLGSSSLSSLLFHNKTRRLYLHISKFTANDVPFTQLSKTICPIWMRESLFLLHKQSIIVREYIAENSPLPCY